MLQLLNTLAGLLALIFLLSIARTILNSWFRGKRGVVTSLGELSCGRASVLARVRLDSGEEVRAELSPCTICMERLGVGSKVKVIKLGDRVIAKGYG